MNYEQSFSQLNLKEIYTNRGNNNNCICCRYCSIFLFWFFSIGTWAFTIWVIINQNYINIILAGIFYINYLLKELCNPIIKIFSSISNQTLNEIVEKFLKGKPNFSLNCESFHYEERPAGEDSTRTVEVVTHRQSLDYNYRYYRDISGLLIFNPDEKIMKHKSFIYLKIIKKAYLPDENSISYYESLKNTLEENRNRDKYFRLYENIDIEGQPNEFFIKRKEKDPWFANGLWHVIFTILTFAEPYKLYIKKITYCQTFIIKKVISIENDVNLDQRFDSFKPSLYIRYSNQHFQFNFFSAFVLLKRYRKVILK